MIAAPVVAKSARREPPGRGTTRESLLELLGRPSADRWKDFRDSYCHEQGSTLFVLFKKSLSATTIQYAELLALIRMASCSDRKDFTAAALQFVSEPDMRSWFDSVCNNLNPKNTKKGWAKIAKLYRRQLEETVLLDAYFTSCVIRLPPGLRIDEMQLCGESGYIHSIGSLLYFTPTASADYSSLELGIKRYLDRIGSKKKTFFSVYSHEDFTSYDRDQESELRDGLDQAKIHVDKFFLGNQRLVSSLRQLKDKLAERLYIPDPGDYRRSHDELNKDDLDLTRSIWLIRDNNITADGRRGDLVHFACYAQHFVNKNPFHLFDENKPAWVSHTTIPHTLLGAMINIPRPYFRQRGNQAPIIVDPFAGSGTTFLESSKFDGFRCFASDLSHASKLLSQDNAHFFSLGVAELDDLLQRLESVNAYVERGARNLEDPQLWLGFDRKDDVIGPVYDWAFDLVSSVPNRDEHPDSDIVSKLQEKDFFARLIFYIAIRTRMRNIAAFEREARDWRSAFLKESTVLLGEIKKLRTLRQSRLTPVTCGNRQLFAIQTRYSTGVSFKCDLEARMRARGVLREAQDATDKAGYPKGVELIVTDPPYGFNTDVEAIELAEVWALSLEAMIGALANNGQLVICLPDHSHTGRTLQHFTLKEFVTNQVISIARSLRREAITAGEIVPAPGCLFRPPYRWEAARALRRSILHFRFRSMM